MRCQLYHIFPMNLHCFHVNVAWGCFCYVNKMTTSRSRRVSLEGAHVHETSLCVAPGAPRFGTKFRSLSQCSKYVTFSITFGPHVLQTTVCVMFFRASPLRSVESPGRPSGSSSRQIRPRPPGRHGPGRNHGGKVAPERPKYLTRRRHKHRLRILESS